MNTLQREGVEDNDHSGGTEGTGMGQGRTAVFLGSLFTYYWDLPSLSASFCPSIKSDDGISIYGEYIFI